MRTTRTTEYPPNAARAAFVLLHAARAAFVPFAWLMASVGLATAMAQTAPAAPTKSAAKEAVAAPQGAAASTADPGLGWLAGLAGNCWRARPAIEGMSEMCFAFEDDGRAIKAETLGPDAKPVGATTFRVAQSNGVSYLSARSVHVASGREETYSIGFEWNNPKGPLTHMKYDKPELMSSSGYSRTTWRPLDRNRFEVESFYQYGGGAQGFRQSKWIFTRGRRLP